MIESHKKKLWFYLIKLFCKKRQFASRAYETKSSESCSVQLCFMKVKIMF